MVKSRKYVVKNTFVGVPKREDFEIVEEELRSLEDGEVLVKTEWVSVDPYHRYQARCELPYEQFGYQVGVVQESRDPKFVIGSRVVSHKGWAEYAILNRKEQTKFLDDYYLMPDLQGLSPSLAIGALGMPGATAYFGFLEICQPKAGETVVVTGAAGAVGSLVGQIAKIKGCRVIGFAGSDEKVKWLEKDLGFDKAINYKTADIAKELEEAATKGVDCYFDNVGGEISNIIMSQMNDFGRVSVCGAISVYNDPSQIPKATYSQMTIVLKQLKIEGFVVTRWMHLLPEALKELIPWIKSGQLKAREHVTEGFDMLYEGFVGMLTGDNFGKAVVKV